MPLPLSLYIHFPWCLQKCPYCDFNSHAVKTAIPEHRYIDTLLADLTQDLSRYQINRPIQSIFMGGGTPSLFSAKAIGRLLTEIRNRCDIQKNAEITLEANPGTFESQKFADFKAVGINRLSIGIQSFNDSHLKKLGRIHDSQQAIMAVETAQQMGFAQLNLDLMFGLPQQTLQQSLFDIQTAIDLKPTHISFYQLTVEPNTYFQRFPPQLPDDELIFNAQQQCQAVLSESDYQQYEVSAYAKSGAECLHNCNYWQFGDYLGIGAGAAGKISLECPKKIVRTLKTKHPTQYLSAPTVTEIWLNPEELPLEFLMNQLRLKKGFSLADYQRTTGLTAASLEPGLSIVCQEGLLIQEHNQFRCSEQGWHFLDNVLERFIS